MSILNSILGLFNTTFGSLLFIMFMIGVVVFVSLYYVDAGYGKMRSDKWGPCMNNKAGWLLMECPVFFVVLYEYLTALGDDLVSDKVQQVPYWIFLLIFEFHYFQRSFIFPFLLKGKSKMPLVIMFLSVVWNVINGYIQGHFLFHIAPADSYYAKLYSVEWVTDPRFIIGTVIFFTGWIINMHSDHVIRHLRKPGDTNHYLPKKGMYKYVTSANYLGEITEWLGFAILTWSLAGLLFFWFSCCNLVPRSNAIYKKYEEEFPDEFDRKKLKRIIPFIY